MGLLSTGDLSGRPDTSGVDSELAEDYARRMFAAVVSVRFAEARKIHLELNSDSALYVAAMDKFRTICKQRGIRNAAERWREYSGEA